MNQPIELPVSSSLVQQRRKIWATGSYKQISAFARSLSEVDEEAAVGELVILPVRTDSSERLHVQLYAVVDILVESPSEFEFESTSKKGETAVPPLF